MRAIREQIVEKLLDKAATRRWAKASDRCKDMPLDQLRVKRNTARDMRRHLDEVLHVAEGRLSAPLFAKTLTQAPRESDWAWRPEIWSGPIQPMGRAAVPQKSRVGREAALFHDCEVSEITFRQMRNLRSDDLAPYGARFDVFRFDGSFLSLVIDLPPEAVSGLSKRHLVRFDASIELEKSLELFARLNVKHGPNTDQIVREVATASGEIFVEFDLAYTEMNEKRVERIWIELIFENPEMNQIFLRDVSFARIARAEL
ncbi:MAG: DUF6478 family protein [Pseudomonadota bacterium]